MARAGGAAGGAPVAAPAAGVASAAASGAACAVAPTRLTVDYLPSPASASAPASFLPRVTDSRAPLLGWWVSATDPSPRPDPSAPRLGQSAYRLAVATDPARLPAAGGTPDVWDSGVVASPASVAVPYGGPALASRARVFWSVSIWDAAGAPCGWAAANETGAWEVPLLSDADWAGAAWVTRDPQPHPPPTPCAMYADDPAPLLRAPFTTARGAGVARARLYVAGLGYFTPFLDGAQVGDEALAPGWTDFNTTVLYSTFDDTAGVAAGGAGAPHVLGLALGKGWWDLVPLLFWGARSFRDALPNGDPMARAALLIDYDDGSSQAVVTAPGAAGGWAVGASEVAFNSIYLGTRIDRRAEPVGWAAPGFNATGWAPPNAAVTAGLGALRSQRVPPVRRQAPVSPVALPPPAPGQAVLDFGRQIAGVCTFCFRPGAPAGSAIVFRYGELLYANGSVNGMTAVAGQVKSGNGGPCAPEVAFQEDHYTLRGDAAGECFTPPFTWHAGRYAWAMGDAAAVAALDVGGTTCHPMRSDVDVTGSFTSSSPLLNAVHAAAVNTAANNMMSVQSDCPGRERLGYGGDALMAGESLIASFDMALFLEKRLGDFAAAQRPNGGFTETAPFVGISDAGLGGGSGPIGWETYVPAAAMWAYKYHGNVPAVAAAWPAATEYVAFLDAAPAGAIRNGLGDWMALEPKALPLTGLGFQAISYAEYANMSAVVGNASQAAKYAASAANVSAAINAEFLDAATGVYAAAGVFNRTQCGQAMPLFLGIVPAAARGAVVAGLEAALAASGGHLAVGGFGVKYLLMSLVDAGRGDLAWGVMNKTDYPGFGYMLNGTVNGLTSGTTVWESWGTSASTFSHDHPMFTSNVVWAYQGLAGIQPHPAAAGLDRILIKPAPPRDGTLTAVSAAQVTVRGEVSSSWTVDAASGAFTLTVCVPPNMQAEVWLPVAGTRIDAGSCCGCVFHDQLW
jgi:alpha-L-rhamnosidase